jgi:hypothetical protein
VGYLRRRARAASERGRRWLADSGPWSGFRVEQNASPNLSGGEPE